MVAEKERLSTRKTYIHKKLLLFSCVLFALILIATTAAHIYTVRQTNQAYIEQQLTIAMETLNLRLANETVSELTLATKLGNTPAIRDYFMNPGDPELEAAALAEFALFEEHVRSKFVFWVNDLDKIFYATGLAAYVVDPDDPETYWYNMTLYETETYNFNINYNPDLNFLTLWVNVPVFDDQGETRKPVGMLGTSIDLIHVANYMTSTHAEFDNSIDSYLFNHLGEITAAAEFELVANKILLPDYLGEAGAEILSIFATLPPEDSLFFTYGDRVYLISSIPEMRWGLALSYPSPGLSAINQHIDLLFFSMILLILLLFVAINFFVSRLENVIAKQEVKLESAKLSELMLDTSPMCVQLWNREGRTIGCNDAAVKLYGFQSKQEYLDRFLRDCSPAYQPDGQPSKEKALMLVQKAFEDGSCVFEWLHQLPDGTPIPSEITLVRVSYEDDSFLVGYTRDLRRILKLEETAEKINYDPLTEIYNRRFFDKNLTRFIQSLSRTDSPLTLMMIDIDFFKNYNDAYGHTAGDNCLKIVAQTLSEGVTRADDFVVRYGGEEFMAVLPNTDERGAHLIAERLLQSIRDQKIPHKQSDVADHLTISIGVVTGTPKHKQNAKDYIDRADEMLYRSKRGGRNRYSFDYL